MVKWLLGIAVLALMGVALSWVRDNPGLALMLIGGAIAILGLIAHIRDTGRFQSFTLFSGFGLGVMLLALIFAVPGLGDLLGWWHLRERPMATRAVRRMSESDAGHPAGAEAAPFAANGG